MVFQVMTPRSGDDDAGDEPHHRLDAVRMRPVRLIRPPSSLEARYRQAKMKIRAITGTTTISISTVAVMISDFSSAAILPAGSRSAAWQPLRSAAMAKVSTPARRVLLRACFISLSAGTRDRRPTRVSKVDAGVGWANPHYFAKLCCEKAGKVSAEFGYS